MSAVTAVLQERARRRATEALDQKADTDQTDES